MRSLLVAVCLGGIGLLGACTQLLGDFQSGARDDGGSVDGAAAEEASAHDATTSGPDAMAADATGAEATTSGGDAMDAMTATTKDAAIDHYVASEGSAPLVDAGQDAGPVHGTGSFDPVIDIVIDAGVQAKTGLTASDLSGDGVPDLAACSAGPGSGFSVFVSNKDKTFKQSETSDNPASNCVGIVAINSIQGAGGTPYLALLEATSPPQISLYESDPGGINYYLFFTPSGLYSTRIAGNYSLSGVTPSFVAADDFNGDGLLDVAVTAYQSSFQIIQNLGPNGLSSTLTGSTLTATPGTTINVSEAPADIVFQDISGDAVPDAIVGANGVQGYVALADTAVPAKFMGLGALRPSWPDPSNPTVIQPRGVASGDFDGDGRFDVAFADYATGDVAVFYNEGASGGYVNWQNPTPPLPNVGTAPYDIASADFNGDGKWDLAVSATGTNGGQVTVLFSQGRTWSAAAKVLPLAGSADTSSSIVVGDFNADLKQDIAVLYTSRPAIGVFFGQ